MPYFLHQISYTQEALAKLIANSQDRFEAVRGPIEKLGGKIKDSYFAFGPSDVVLITEMPDSVSAAGNLGTDGTFPKTFLAPTITENFLSVPE